MNTQLETILREVSIERQRQEELCMNSKIGFSCADPRLGDLVKLPVLMEEVGEVGRAMQENNLGNLREELIQVAAVAVAWAESLERQGFNAESAEFRGANSLRASSASSAVSALKRPHP